MWGSQFLGNSLTKEFLKLHVIETGVQKAKKFYTQNDGLTRWKEEREIVKRAFINIRTIK